MKRKMKTVMLSILFLGLISKNAYAYLDPGSGSYLIQIIIAGLLAASFALKTFWQSIKNFFIKIFSSKKENKK